jgi:hypothetical protein
MGSGVKKAPRAFLRAAVSSAADGVVTRASMPDRRRRQGTHAVRADETLCTGVRQDPLTDGDPCGGIHRTLSGDSGTPGKRALLVNIGRPQPKR